MTINELCKSAEEHFQQLGEKGIRQILEAPTAWIVLPGPYGKVRYGSFSIVVEKETGEIRPFVMPSQEGFALLKVAQEVPVPEEYIYMEEEEDGIQ